MIRLGVIGYGHRISNVIRRLQRLEPEARIAAITDVRNDEIRAKMGAEAQEVKFFTDPDEMLDKAKLDAALIGTRCSLHTAMAVKVAARKLPLYLEKPVATTMDDLRRLKKAFDESKSEVVISFPLRLTTHVKLVKEIIASGRIGTVEHVQAYNNVTYGGIYFYGWYRDWNETGGLFLQKATHDLDYINHILGQRPVRIAAMKSQRVMGGDRPAGLYCRDCKEWESCLESPRNRFYMRGETEHIAPGDRQCMFAVDAGNEDNGSALVEYESGMHVCYSQNFFVRRDAGTRGATFMGYKGTVQFDWRTDKVKLVIHHRPVTELITVERGEGHSGGDLELLGSFIKIIRGEGPSSSPLSAGILSAYMCLKARESSETHEFLDLDLKELDS